MNNVCKIKKKRYLDETHPEVLVWWDFSKNTSIFPDSVTYGSGKKVWWKCDVCGYCRYAQIKHVVKRGGCPACNGKVVTIANCLFITHPEIADQWHPTKNGDLSPKDVSYGSNKEVWWLCSECGNIWFASITSRTSHGGHLCKDCSYILLGKNRSLSSVNAENSLAEKFPEIAILWHPTKNGDRTPENTSYASHYWAWWRCLQCGYVQFSIVSSMTNKKRGSCLCAVCNGKVVSDKNRLSLLYPNVSKEWDFKKNFPLTPNDVSFGSHYEAGWICKICGHSWDAIIKNRTRKESDCPKCFSRSVSKIGCRWLDGLGVPEENREFWFADLRLRVDAYDPATNTVYEFLGDFWHGNPNVFDMEEIHPIRGISYGKLFDETMERLFLLKRCGYNLVVMWEEDFCRDILNKL